MKLLLDTNVVIDFLRGNSSVVVKVSEVVEDGLGVSAVSLAELCHGAQRSLHPKANLDKVNKFFNIPRITLFPLDTDIAEEYGKLMSELEKSGVKLAPLDVMIAATARHHRLAILTEDKKHFPRLNDFGIKVELI